MDNNNQQEQEPRQEPERQAPPQAWEEPALLRNTPLGVLTKFLPGTFYVIDGDGRFVLWNRKLEQVTEMTPEQLRATHAVDLFAESDRAVIEQRIRAVLDDNEEVVMEATLVSQSGRISSYLLSGARIECNNSAYLCGIGLDQTSRRQQESLLRLRERALHAASNGIVITRCAGKENPIEYVNPAFERITGYSAAESMGRDSRFMAAPGLDDDERTQLRDAISERREANVIFRNLRKDGTLFWNELSITPVLDEKGVATHYIGVINDITAVKQRTTHLEHRLNHDPLTGLANRNLLWDRLEQALHIAQRNKTLVAILLVDLNKFKLINDTFGHEAGDMVLTSVAKRMQASVRDSDTVARLSGDEFVLVLANQPSLRYTLRMIDRLRDGLSKPISFNGGEIPVGASMGVSVYPHDGDAAIDLVKSADIAMYHAKSVGKSDVHFYSADMKSSSDAKRRFEAEMRAALENEEFFLLFQPRRGVKSGTFNGVEALLRWRHPQQGILTPATFMLEAEENGMLRPIGQRVFHLVTGFMADMRDSGYPDLLVSVNASYREFSEQNYIGNLCRRLDDLNLPARNLELEMSESNLLRNLQLSQGLTRQMRDAGIRLSVDDFGDGLTSLSGLLDLAPAHLKVNRAAVGAITPAGGNGVLARMLIDIGHSLNVQMVGECVETEAQASFLRDHGCDELQGNYVSSPLAACALKQLLEAPPI
jgi:diguanylate cyclase (GGDEF)-like protein/PAS domain S-box-containing protein